MNKKMLLNVVVGMALLAVAPAVQAAAKVMNPGEAYGQLVYLSASDVISESAKYKSLTPVSIPVWAELPTDMSVVAGSITLKQQNLLSHVQLKSRARHTPNLDISDLEGGAQNALIKNFVDGAWVHMLLKDDAHILIEASTEAQAQAFYDRSKPALITLRADMTATGVFRTQDLRSVDAIRVGSKAANYGELADVLNTASRTVVRPGFGIPFSAYQEFVDANPKVKAAIDSILSDPLMNRVAKVTYRDAKLKALRDMMTSPDSVVSDKLVDDLLPRFDQLRSGGVPRKLKLRSSTNSEDLPNFNGAGLYDSYAYKPSKDGKEKKPEKKREALKETLRQVWASVWNLRAFDERAYFRIPHAQVKMGIQVNPAFGNEGADGVIVTKNMSGDARYPGPGVYIETQRGDKYSVTNPAPTIKPTKILVSIDGTQPLNQDLYQIHTLQTSNVADDGETILPQDNPTPVLRDEEIKDLAFQVLKAQEHFKKIYGANNPNFALDLEFKVDSEDTGNRQVYLKQARPYID